MSLTKQLKDLRGNKIMELTTSGSMPNFNIQTPRESARMMTLQSQKSTRAEPKNLFTFRALSYKKMPKIKIKRSPDYEQKRVCAHTKIQISNYHS